MNIEAQNTILSTFKEFHAELDKKFQVEGGVEAQFRNENYQNGAWIKNSDWTNLEEMYKVQFPVSE